MGECSTGMSGKAGIPWGSFRGPCGSAGSLTQCMAVSSPRRRLPQRRQWRARSGFGGGGGGRRDGPERAIFDLQSQSGKQTYVTLNRPGLSSNHNESCFERVCCLLAACQVFAEC